MRALLECRKNKEAFVSKKVLYFWKWKFCVFVPIEIHLVEFPLDNFLLSIESSVGNFSMSTAILTSNQISHVTIKLRSIWLDTSLFTMAPMALPILVSSPGSFAFTAFLTTFGPLVLNGRAGFGFTFLVNAPTVTRSVKALDFNVRTIGSADGHKNGDASFVGGFQGS